MYIGFWFLGVLGVFLIVAVVGLDGRADVFVESPDNTEEASTVILWCSISEENVTLSWYHRGRLVNCQKQEQKLEIGKWNETCDLGTPNWDTIGQYICSFNVTTNTTTGQWETRNATINVESPPGVVKQEKGKVSEIEGKENEFEQQSVAVKEGDEAVIKCIFRGFPPPAVTWRIREERGNETTEKDLENGRTIIANETGFNSTYTLKISEVQSIDRKFYICVAENKYGSIRVYNLLRVKETISGKLAWLWPFLGILLEVVIFGAIIFFVQWKENKRRDSDIFDAPDDDDD